MTEISTLQTTSTVLPSHDEPVQYADIAPHDVVKVMIII